MAKYLVRCKASVYYDVEVEAEDEMFAEDEGTNKLGQLLEPVMLPSPLEWEGFEAWEIEEMEDSNA